MNIVRIEIERMREQVASVIADQFCEIEQEISDQINQTLTEEWVKHEIKKCVDTAIKQTIEGMTNNYSLRSMLEEKIVSVLVGDKETK